MPDKNKKILIVTESIDINDSSAAKGKIALIENLHSLNFDINVLHYTPKDIFLKDIRCKRIEERKLNINYVLSRIQRVLQRLLKINFSKPLEHIFGFSFTYFNDVNSIKKAVKIELKEQSYDLIITLSKGASFRVHKALLGLEMTYKKWMAYMHDPYPFCYYPEPHNWNEAGYKQKIKFFEKVSKTAKYAAFPSQLLQEWMSQYFPSFNNTGVIIPHQTKYELHLVEKLPEYFDIKKFTLLHAGNLLKQRDPQGLIEGFQLFLQKNPEAEAESSLLLLGPGNYHEKNILNYKKDCPQLYWSNGNVDFDIVYKIQLECSINIILEAKAEVSPFLPGKFPHCIAANKPILHLGPEHSETRRLLGKDYPYYAEIDDAERIAQIIEDLYHHWKEDSSKMTLNRSDLEHYLGVNYLYDQITKCLNYS